MTSEKKFSSWLVVSDIDNTLFHHLFLLSKKFMFVSEYKLLKQNCKRRLKKERFFCMKVLIFGAGAVGAGAGTEFIAAIFDSIFSVLGSSVTTISLIPVSLTPALPSQSEKLDSCNTALA